METILLANDSATINISLRIVRNCYFRNTRKTTLLLTVNIDIFIHTLNCGHSQAILNMKFSTHHCQKTYNTIKMCF